MNELIKQLFVNSAILIAALFIIGQHISTKPLNYYSQTKLKLLIGVLAGLIGSILVFFGVQLKGAVVVDFRYISLIVSSIYGGPIASIVGGLIIAAFRVFFIGKSYASVMGALFVLSVSIGCGMISKIKYNKKTKWILMIFYAQINSFFSLKVVIPNYQDLISTFIPYSLSFIFLGVLVYYYYGTISLANKHIRHLKEESTKDFLTELNNVRSFDILYNTALKTAQEKSQTLSIILIDIDHFKRVNDTYGHQAGDNILKQLGEILNQGCRSFDIVSRNGGEEFSVILTNCTNIKAYDIADRIRKMVEGHAFLLNDDSQINITISLGIATYPDSATDNESLFENADRALYKAKNSGRNRVCYYSPDSLTYCELKDNKISS
jgi:diguanylate cyclase